ncbi:SubName: Full=Uncharacterized protein {ECO:0000313/EMBL:CCA66955.1} [Serendipita indica DSM 11827]|uniref:Kinetochore protein mis14 n=1 Tax=Serendipita indica (strain DSM 11827) TaxID=1109443 RepID=G4T6G8_SERID|nr:SubName: Full=Uncharacterized protein {ECO:0000313/EMBL:CCA66955.1} [Serendipita indica DSM 11827]CCA66955.1 hypothetical protein PIIN_00793 [Serendipita indica DSM 11827]
MPAHGLSRVTVPSMDSYNAIKDNFRKAVLNVLSTTLPGNKDAAKRALLEKELLKWVDDTFALAGPNLRVNGVNFEEYVDQPRRLPFDEALDRTVIALREQSLVSEQTIAERRRTVPAKVQELLVDLLERQRAAEKALLSELEEVPSVADEDEFSFVAREPELREEILEAQREAERLKETIPRELQRAQWVQEVSAELAAQPTAQRQR